MKLKLNLRASQTLVMTPQLQQAIKLLQFSRLELQQVVAQHLMENPLLEELNADVDEGDGTASEEAVPVNKEEMVGDGDAGEEVEEKEADEFSEPISPDGWEDYYESDWPSGGNGSPGSAIDCPSYEQTMENPARLEDHLLWQLRLSSEDEEEKTIGLVLIGNLDEDGYLRTSIEEVAEEASVSVKKVDSVLSLIQTFDPIGVAARDLRECLLIQLRHLQKMPIGSDDIHGNAHPESLLELIIRNHLHDLQRKQYDKVAKKIGRPVEEIYEAVHVIEGLEPKPGRPYCSDVNQVIVPDVFVCKDEGEWQVFLNEEGMPRVRISPDYERMLGARNGDGEAARAYLEKKLRGARWILRSLEQRNRTILKVVKSLIKFQEPFLERGIRYLKPCVLKQVAEDVGMHESTISRVTRNKYMHCPQGLLELKFFFDGGIQRATPGAEFLSSHTVRELIREMVDKEDPRKLLDDRDIVLRLRDQGITIAQRSVATYRAKLRIAPASQRKRTYVGQLPQAWQKAAGPKRQKREKTKLGLKLEEILREKDIARKEFMDAIKIHQAGISYLLRKTVWRSNLLKKISTFLNVPRTTFLECYEEQEGDATTQLRKNLAWILRDRNMTLAELAKKAEIPSQTVTAYMTTRKMQKRTQEHIAMILGVSLEEFRHGKRDANGES